MALALILLQLIVLHRSDGGEVTINPAQITTLRTPAGPLAHLSPFARCIVYLTDGKQVAVLETCEAVKTRLEPPP
jgi:hypothetical protein